MEMITKMMKKEKMKKKKKMEMEKENLGDYATS